MSSEQLQDLLKTILQATFVVGVLIWLSIIASKLDGIRRDVETINKTIVDANT